MLNPKTNLREFCYVVIIDKIEPIIGSDNCECATVMGWHVMVRKNQFQLGDLAIYFEVDSQVPSDREYFSFLSKRKYKIKTQKFTFGGKGNFISQGLLMHPSDFGWHVNLQGEIDDGEMTHTPIDETRFLTKKLGVTHIEDEDNKPAQRVDKYKAMAQRRPDIFKRKWARWLMRREWGRKLMFALFGRKKKKSETAFPTKFPFVKKSDEERIENMPFLLKDKQPWIKTQKIDGTSSTYILARGRFGRFEKYVCSRNVRQLTPSQKNYHKDIDGNVYWMMAEKYHIFEFLKKYLIENKLSYVCLQGETAGPSLQGNPHKFKEICFFGYNFIRSDSGRMNSVEAAKICEGAGIPWVPIVDTAYILPDDMETLKLDADGPCIVGEGMREGWVCRSYDGKQSFKNVSNLYLLKHNI